jgi:hypothetical protein
MQVWRFGIIRLASIDIQDDAAKMDARARRGDCWGIFGEGFSGEDQ